MTTSPIRLYTVLLVDVDSLFLHWLVINIPGTSLADGQVDGWTHPFLLVNLSTGQVDKQGWMDGWRNGFIGGWLDGETERQIETNAHLRLVRNIVDRNKCSGCCGIPTTNPLLPLSSSLSGGCLDPGFDHHNSSHSHHNCGNHSHHHNHSHRILMIITIVVINDHRMV